MVDEIEEGEGQRLGQLVNKFCRWLPRRQGLVEMPRGKGEVGEIGAGLGVGDSKMVVPSL